MKSLKRQEQNQRKKYKKTKNYLDGGGQSKYARKRAYCLKNAVWGFEVPEPKPWKGKKS